MGGIRWKVGKFVCVCYVSIGGDWGAEGKCGWGLGRCIYEK
jgi:hypothetical protein